jgi:signal transduction histidine kinase
MNVEVNKLFEENQLNLRRRVDRAFGWLILGQWAFAILLAFVMTPSSWPNDGREPYTHLWMAFILGAMISALPIYFSFIKPGNIVGGYVIAIAQMCFSALIIYLNGGRIEAHFHIFGSLAFLASYRNWRLLIAASAVIILDHLVRGFYFPLSVYGVSSDFEWHWLEYTAWIIFEDIFLVYSCIQATKEMKQTTVVHWELMNARLVTEDINIRRTQFFSMISHEIRTPLSGIIGFSDFLKDSLTPTEQKEFISIIKLCSETMLKLVNDLLDFSRIDSGCLDIDPHQFKISDIRDYLEKVFSLECQKKNLQFRFDISEGVPNELIGDSHRIRQVLTNIVANAVKFTDKGGIYIKLDKQHPDSNIYRWLIEDTGLGIKKDNLTKIFNPYTQEFSSTARNFGGSGLGLFISKRLVELMGGELDVESTVGEGTVFFFTIPLKSS